MPLSRVSFLGPAQPPREFHWFHVILTAYGAWLPGDPRGFRTRHHREHVEGDYKTPPPRGTYTSKLHRSRALMKQPLVRLDSISREAVGMALVFRLHKQGAFVLAAAVASQHAHLLVKLPARDTRIWIGNAKRHAWYVMRERGWQKKLWAKRAKFTPVNDRQHQYNTLRYIVVHEKQEACILSHTRSRGHGKGCRTN